MSKSADLSTKYHQVITEVFKWTVSQDLSSPVIFVKQLILIPINLPTKKLFQTFMNIYEDILSFSCFATVSNTGNAKRKTLGWVLYFDLVDAMGR
jgi:hypothetical protein